MLSDDFSIKNPHQKEDVTIKEGGQLVSDQDWDSGPAKFEINQSLNDDEGDLALYSKLCPSTK